SRDRRGERNLHLAGPDKLCESFHQTQWILFDFNGCHNYIVSSSKRVEVQAAPRRVRTIYSVIASPQRLEILKILNVKGTLTYSALKSLAGFKSKKESGKFAYHLRKLVRQLLIPLNRPEREYTATNLGRLVLNLTRQIEEQSLIESGKLYVRTTRQAMEEFNADKILQSLV